MKHFCLLLLACVCLVAFRSSAGDDSRAVAFISKHTALAMQIHKKYGIPASICLAQCMVESGLGSSMLAQNANNYFGIKCHGDWNGESVLKQDDEKDKSCFRKYGSVEASFEDYGKRLSTYGVYSKLKGIPTSDYVTWAKEIKAAGYATNQNYDRLLIAKIEEFDLTKYDRLDWPDHYEPLSTPEHTNNTDSMLSVGPSIDLNELSEIEKALNGLNHQESTAFYLPAPVVRPEKPFEIEAFKPQSAESDDHATGDGSLKIYVSPPASHPLQIRSGTFKMPIIDIR